MFVFVEILALIEDWGRECPDLNPAALGIVGRIMRLGRRYEQEATDALKPFGLHYTDFDIIATLRRSGPPYALTPGELGTAVLLTSGAMTAALDRLQRSELITRHASDTDRRVKAAKLTSKGRRVARAAAAARFEVAQSAVAGLSAAELSRTTSLLRKLL